MKVFFHLIYLFKELTFSFIDLLGCLFRLYFIYFHSEKRKSINHSVVSNSLGSQGLEPARLFCPWNSPGNSTGVGNHSLLQGTIPTQELNLGLLHCRQILYHLSHQGSPYFHSNLYFFISSVNFGLFCSSFSSFFRYKTRLFICDFSCF